MKLDRLIENGLYKPKHQLIQIITDKVNYQSGQTLTMAE